MTADRTAIVARHPELAPLLAVQDPPWQMYAHALGPVHGERASDSYFEVFYMADPESVCGIRETFSGWQGPAVRPVDFLGSLEDVVAELLTPVELEDLNRDGDETNGVSDVDAVAGGRRGVARGDGPVGGLSV